MMMTMGGNNDMQGDRSRGRDCHSWHSKVKPVILKDDQDHDDYNDDDHKLLNVMIMTMIMVAVIRRLMMMIL